jgi:hypothetical protein
MSLVVAIVGMPGSGKSTLSRYLAPRLASHWDVTELSLDDALNVQCPPGEVEFLGRQLYRRCGSEFLIDSEWRPRQMKLAASGLFVLSRLADRLGPTGGLPRMSLLEFPLTELPSLEDSIVAENLSDGLLVMVSAEPSTCRTRNSLRSERERVPEIAMAYFEAASQDVNVPVHCQRLQRQGWKVIEESTEGTAQEVLPRIATKVERLVASEAFCDVRTSN